MDVGGWLRSLGLGQYEANFRDNKIDADVLPQLDGGRSQGHRRLSSRRSAQAARRNRRPVWSNAFCERACLLAQARAGQGS